MKDQATGQPLANSLVLAYTADTGLQAVAVGGITNANGEYVISSLQPGDYKATAGYTPATPTPAPTALLLGTYFLGLKMAI